MEAEEFQVSMDQLATAPWSYSYQTPIEAESNPVAGPGELAVLVDHILHE